MGGAVVIDHSLFLPQGDQRSDGFLPPAADALLRRLRYSNLTVAICYPEDCSSPEVIHLIDVSKKYSFHIIPQNLSCLEDSINKFRSSSVALEEPCVYTTSRRDDGLFLNLINCGWKVILKSSESYSLENQGTLIIDKLERFLVSLHRLVKMELGNMPVVSVGYVMKPSREQDFAKRGAFPIFPTPNGLMFVPLNLEVPLGDQMQEIDVVLHKATDEIVNITSVASSNSQYGVTYSRGMQQLQRYFLDDPHCCIIDPLDNISPLLDRFKIQELLTELEGHNKETRRRVRGPHFLKVDTYYSPNLMSELSHAKLSFPNIVKPQVACGVADAHSMALVFKIEHYRDLHVPLPAVIQEYVDHSSMLYKIYVLGEKVFYAVKKSMPNAEKLWLSYEKNGSAAILFDSLKSLPAADIDIQANAESLDIELAEGAANWLRKRLNLTIFGFDILVQDGSGDHVIVDVNYLPSFKEIPDDAAIPAFWHAIKSSYECKKTNMAV